MTRAEQAVKGMDITTAGGIVMIDDGADRWLCHESDWDARYAELNTCAPYESGDANEDIIAAYDDLCQIHGPVASVIGSSQGEYEALVQRAVAAGLIDQDTAQRGYGVRIPYGQLTSGN